MSGNESPEMSINDMAERRRIRRKLTFWRVFSFLCIAGAEFLHPLRIHFGFHQFRQHGQGFLTVAPYTHGRFHILVYLRRINIQMDHFCLLGIYKRLITLG